MYWTRRFRRRLRRRLSRAKRGEQYKVEDQAGNVVIRLHGDNHFLIVPDFLAGTLLEEVPRGVEIGPGFHPATVINLGGEGRADLDTKISTFSADPEFGIQFLETVILIGQHSRAALASQRITALAEAGCKSIYTSQDSILEGPYFIKGRNIYRTWRLFPDIYDAFQLPTIPDHADPERFVGVTIMVDGQLMVPVPSRLHYPPSRKKPLNGIRLTVKDLIDLKGVKTTGQSRSYAATYGPRLHTANTVARLISLGAIVIGKTKCTQFGSSDQPTADWVDFHCPWNPRGDKYLSPRGSSTGTCVAVAGYLWCDFGVGTDTGGSIRGPASVMGLFALRPTYAEELLSGILLITSNMDTPGLVCRDTKLLHQVSHQLLAVPSKTHQEPDQTSPPLPHRPNHQRLDGSIKSRDPFGSIWRLGKLLLCRARESLPSPSTTEEPPLPGLDQPKKPTILIFPTDYWNQWPENAVKLKMEAAVKSLEAYLGIKRTCLNLGEAWLTHDPCQDGTALNAYLEETFMTFLWRGYYTNFLSFRNDHKEKFGTKPYVHPVIQDCWRRGEKISESDVAKARTTKQVYSTWVRDKILGGDGFNTIMVYPVGDFTPFYRDVYRPDPEDRPQNYKWDEREDHQSSLAGIPSIIIPVGQVAQPSKITGGEQELPVCISLMSGAGTDSLLTGLVHDMAVKGFLPGEVNTGEKAF